MSQVIRKYYGKFMLNIIYIVHKRKLQLAVEFVVLKTSQLKQFLSLQVYKIIEKEVVLPPLQWF